MTEVNDTGKRRILPGVPLSDEDRAYLLVRGQDRLVADHDTNWPAVEPDEDEEEPMPDFASMNKDALQAYATERGVDSGGTKPELVARLTEWWDAD